MSRHLPSLRALRAFEAAARHLSFARAADELHVTPAAVSQQIKALEAELGIVLFQRGPHLTLSARAQDVLAEISEGFDSLERATARLRCVRQDGPLVVSMPPTFAARWLIPRLERFHAAHPGIDLRLMTTPRLVDFATEDVDGAVRYGSGRYAGLDAILLKSEMVLPVAVPSLAEKLKTPADLLTVPLLHNQAMNWDSGHPDWIRWLTDNGVEVPRNPTIRSFNDATLLIEAVTAGLGVALTWRGMIREDLRSGRLVAPFPGRWLKHAYYLVSPPWRRTNQSWSAFRDWILAEAAPERDMPDEETTETAQVSIEANPSR